MTKGNHDTKQVKKRIKAQLEEVREELSYLERRLQNKPEFGLGSGNTGVYSWEMAMSRKERATQHQEELREALQRIDAGTYGICLQCGNAVNPERLDILPATQLCITCAVANDEGSYRAPADAPA